jgi:aspartyl-tRNA(Asn)/glutamyl-tRNA(Gln) amidotransferase subunit A
MGVARTVEPQVAELVAAAAKRFGDLGAHVEQVDPPGGDPGEIFRILWWAGAGYVFGDAPAKKKALLDPDLAAVAEEGAAIPLRRYIEANVLRGAYASQMRVFMERYDFLLTPSLAVAAFDVGMLSPYGDGGSWPEWTPFSYPFNLTQQPAASVPCGRTREGLPVGLQIVGRHYDDWGVLQAARAYESADPHFDDTPKGFA